MKQNISRLAAFLLAASMCVSLAGCGDSKTEEKTEKEQISEAVEELDDAEKAELAEIKEEVDAEINNDDGQAADSSEEEAPAEDLGLKDPKYYTYYEDLAKSYAEDGMPDCAGEIFYISGPSPIMYANGKVYITYGGSKKWLYSYDIASGSLEKVFEFAGKEDGKYDYSSWFVKGDDLYLMYNATVYGDAHIEKVGKDGSVEDYDPTDGFMVNRISYVFDNGKILITANNNDSFEIYDPAEKKLTKLDVIPVPSDHAGVTQDAENPMFLFGKGSSFYFGDGVSSMLGGDKIKDGTVYEYNTDTDEASVFLTDDALKGESLSISIFGDYLMSSTGSSIDRVFSLMKLSDGTKIVDNSPQFAPYLGGECSYYRDHSAGKWYELRYPDSTCTLTYENADALINADEPISDEDGSTIYQLDDKYYVYNDDAGYFLRTYEKGKADEQLIISQNQLDE
ncbi:hypothetical protein [Ruminococcus sp.]|uniref:hypothetical protein n=1 Tax=Ruminococcus sp. TaxID=41978 RepID=UPI0025E3C4DF|nr:hypothetical protein [Ruminococcus sp.]MBQ8965140.1 hypothetical protein [Ruminococcus sp.]